MASGGKRGAGERVLESKHVIVLFLLMLLFSGLFFTLGYVMGRNQYDGQVRAAPGNFNRPEPAMLPKAEPVPKKTPAMPPVAETASDPATSSNSDWEFYSNNKPAKSEPRLEPAPRTPAVPPPSMPVSAKTGGAPASAPPKTVSTSSAPAIPSGALMLQVAACLRQDDAAAIASSLQKKHYAVVVLNPQKDKYYRVQVGPLKDQKAAEATKKGLESAGFKAFYVKH
jgi:cell division septation protein DedD